MGFLTIVSPLIFVSEGIGQKMAVSEGRMSQAENFLFDNDKEKKVIQLDPFLLEDINLFADRERN